MAALLANAPDARASMTVGRTFVLSASLGADDASQWRLYGDNGAGYAIEIETTHRLTVVAAEKLKGGMRTWGSLVRDSAAVSGWTRTNYALTDLDDIMYNLCNWAEHQQNVAIADVRAGDEEAYGDLGEAMFAAMSALALALKPPGYVGEAEARVTATVTGRSPHIDFRATPYGIAEHVHLSVDHENPGSSIIFGGAWELPIKSITLGPRLNATLASNAVRDLLHRKKYEVAPRIGQPGVAIRSSRVPMR